jgi:AcrR family transcriptional regulator
VKGSKGHDGLGGTPAERRAAILDAARVLFARNGYANTGMSDIADALKIRAPSLYNYVPSKQDLLREIMVTYSTNHRAAIEDAFALSDDPVEKIRRGIEEQVRYRIRNPLDLQITAREWLNLDEKTRLAVREAHDQLRYQYRDIIDDGVRQGAFSTPNSEITAYLLLEMGGWLNVLRFSFQLHIPETKLVYWYGDQALRLLRPWSSESGATEADSSSVLEGLTSR